MKYKSITVTRRGGPEVLQVSENELRESGQTSGSIVALSPELL